MNIDKILLAVAIGSMVGAGLVWLVYALMWLFTYCLLLFIHSFQLNKTILLLLLLLFMLLLLLYIVICLYIYLFICCLLLVKRTEQEIKTLEQKDFSS